MLDKTIGKLGVLVEACHASAGESETRMSKAASPAESASSTFHEGP